jgi:hypothetical protein
MRVREFLLLNNNNSLYDSCLETNGFYPECISDSIGGDKLEIGFQIAIL